MGVFGLHIDRRPDVYSTMGEDESQPKDPRKETFVKGRTICSLYRRQPEFSRKLDSDGKGQKTREKDAKGGRAGNGKKGMDVKKKKVSTDGHCQSYISVQDKRVNDKGGGEEVVKIYSKTNLEKTTFLNGRNELG